MKSANYASIRFLRLLIVDIIVTTVAQKPLIKLKLCYKDLALKNVQQITNPRTRLLRVILSERYDVLYQDCAIRIHLLWTFELQRTRSMYSMMILKVLPSLAG